MAHSKSDFKKLKELWYKKLKRDGFKDIEYDEDNLIVYSSEFVKKRSIVSGKYKEEYYYMANQFLNEYSFNSNLERIIWEYHANGMSVRNIAETLRKAKIVNRTGAWVHKFVILKLRNEMKKMYMNG